jgi:hypothetical protein
MLNVTSRLACCCSQICATVVAAALVLVPTVTRAREHLERRETTRLSIRLNWQSDAPPRIVDIAPDESDHAIRAPYTLPPCPACFITHRHAFEELPGPAPCDNSPDLLRGPPR